MARTVLVPVARIPRWFENFATRHGEPSYGTADGALTARAPDLATAEARLPFGRGYGGPPSVADFAAEAELELVWGILLVRRGGFAVAKLRGEHVLVSKVGHRHVLGKTKAGGQSQQRFARRRANQAREAFEAAADHAHRVLLVEGGPPPDVLVCGGDRAAIDAVLGDARLARLSELRTDPWLPVPDPRRSVLEAAIRDASSCAVEVGEEAGR